MNLATDHHVQSALDLAWFPGPQRPLLTGGDVHIWRARLDRGPRVLEALAQLLSAEEAQRASRFLRSKDRHRYIVARGILRSILGRYCAQRPGAIAFTYGPHGKPGVASPANQPIEFNASHSVDLALYAISTGRPIGVDIERVHPHLSYERIARSVLSANELAAWRALDHPDRRDAFLASWTRKEAYLKARGWGLSRPLNTITLHPLADAVHLVAPEDGHAWIVRSFRPAGGFIGALSAADRVPEIRWFDFTTADSADPAAVDSV